MPHMIGIGIKCGVKITLARCYIVMLKFTQFGGILKNLFQMWRSSMSNNEVETVSSEDSLKITENPDGTFKVEWDPNDPRYSMFKGMTEEQINHMLMEGLRAVVESEDELNV